MGALTGRASRADVDEGRRSALSLVEISEEYWHEGRLDRLLSSKQGKSTSTHKPAPRAPPAPRILRGKTGIGSNNYRALANLVADACEGLAPDVTWSGVDRDTIKVKDCSGKGGSKTFRVAGHIKGEPEPRVVALHSRSSESTKEANSEERMADATKMLALAGLAPRRLAQGGDWFIEAWAGTSIGNTEGALNRPAELTPEGLIITPMQGDGQRFYWPAVSTMAIADGARARCLVLRVKASTDVHVKLLPEKPGSPEDPVAHYRIAIGEEGNTASYISREVAEFGEDMLEAWGQPLTDIIIQEDSNLSSIVHSGGEERVTTVNLLNEAEMRTFWVAQFEDVLSFGRGDTPGVDEVLRAPGTEAEARVDVRSFVIATMCDKGTWAILQPDQGSSAATKFSSVSATASVEELGELLARVHDVSTAWYSPWRKALEDEYPGLIDCPHSSCLWWCTARPNELLYGKEDPAFLKAWAERSPAAATVIGSRVVTCHGDFHPGNMVRDAEGDILLIDHEFTFVGSALQDIAWAFLWLDELEDRRTFLRSYLRASNHPATSDDVDALALDAMIFMLTLCFYGPLFEAASNRDFACKDCEEYDALLRIARNGQSDSALRQKILEAGHLTTFGKAQ